MKDIIKAIEIEKKYLDQKLYLNSKNISLLNQLSAAGYQNLNEYFYDKKEYLLSQWNLPVHYIEIAEIASLTSEAIKNNDYSIFIPYGEGIYAYHGSDKIDLNKCEELNVQIIDLNYQGGTIIGSEKDFSIMALIPLSIGINSQDILNAIKNILDKYLTNIEIQGNDILYQNKKILGSMSRHVNECFVWACQVSFEDYSDIIEKICNKKSLKQPSFIPQDLLTKNQFEKEVLSWFLKQ